MMKAVLFSSIVATTVAIAGAASATFVVELNPTEGCQRIKGCMDIDKAKDSTTSTGQVRFTTPAVGLINITANEKVDFSNGYSTIEPPHNGGPFTSLTFTPVDDTAFSDFTFRGQVMNASDPLDVIVTDSNGNSFTIPFTISKPNEDFGRLGVISLDGETIKSVEMTDAGGFEEVKQIDFSLASTTPTIPEPATWALMLIGVGAVGGVLRRRSSGAHLA